MQFDPRLLRYVDKFVLLTTLGLFGVGLLMIASARTSYGDADFFVKKQAIAFAIGLVAMLVVLSFDYSEFGRMGPTIYLVNVALLVAVLVVGDDRGGSQRWLMLGPFPLQVSEIAKLAVIITLASHLAGRESMERWWDLFTPMLHVLPPMLLVVVQPDLGSSLVFVVILFIMLYVAGAPGWRLLAIAVGGLGSVVAWVVAHLKMGIWIPLKPYQLSRLVTFANPDYDPAGQGYQLLQSKIAIGSGGVLGQGLLSGRVTQGAFLPEHHTDFIFSVVGEELGFLGGLGVLLLYAVLLLRMAAVIGAAKDRFGSLLTAGVIAMMGFHVLQNIGMTMGIMPVTGLPLPFISYGGSSLVTSLVAVGIVLNVHMRRQKIMF